MMGKSEFVRQHPDKTPKQVVLLGKKAGFRWFSEAYVEKVRARKTKRPKWSPECLALNVFGNALREVLGLEPIYHDGRSRSETYRTYVMPSSFMSESEASRG